MYILIALPVGKKLTLAKSARFALEPLSSLVGAGNHFPVLFP